MGSPHIRPEQMLGRRFGDLEVVAEAGPRARGAKRRWLCRCACARLDLHLAEPKPYLQGNLRSGMSASCGRCTSFLPGEEHANFRHGDSVRGAPLHWLYLQWRGLRVAARGGLVPVEPDWLADYAAFKAGVGLPDRPEARSLVPVDRDRGYVRGNVCWATPAERRRANFVGYRMLRLGEVEMPSAWWAERLGLSREGLRQRVERWGVERALTEPLAPNAGRRGT